MSSNLSEDSGGPHIPLLFACFESTAGAFAMSSTLILFMLLILPLNLFILYLGIQRWRKQRSGSGSAAMAYSDFCVYVHAIVELIASVSHVLYICVQYLNIFWFVPPFFGLFAWFGQMLIPILTCLERYLAVVHPITYLGLKKVGGVRIRNISMGCVLFLSVGGASFVIMLVVHPHHGLLPSTFVLILFLIIMTFCSISALLVLVRPRPGKASGGGTQVDRSKQKAIQTIMIIMGVLWLKFGWNVVAVILSSSASTAVKCFGNMSMFVFSLPSSLVLPLLFLHRAGKLPQFMAKCGPGGGQSQS